MKKFTVTLCFTVIFLMSGAAFAADALYRMLHADEVESFKKDQDAMIVGKLIGRQGDKFNVEVLKVISGKVNSDYIHLSDDFHYGWGQSVPMLNDFCVMSVKKSGNVYKNAWGIFKADSGNYKTLKLVPENFYSAGLIADLVCIEWYVNSGGTENDFSFNNGNAYVRKSDGQVVQIYPRETAESITTGLSQKDTTTTQGKSKWKTMVTYIVVITLGLIGILAFYLKRRKNTAS